MTDAYFAPNAAYGTPEELRTLVDRNLVPLGADGVEYRGLDNFERPC